MVCDDQLRSPPSRHCRLSKVNDGLPPFVHTKTFSLKGLTMSDAPNPHSTAAKALLPKAQSASNVGRRTIITCWICTGVFGPVIGTAAVPPGLEGREVRIQLDDQALQQIPGDERADLTVTQNSSPTAQALIQATPPGRAIPIIYVIVGILSIPVIWDTIREMLRRDRYGGVLIDARQAPALISHDRVLPADTVLFISPDGHPERYTSRNVPEELLLKIAKVP